MSTKPSSSSEQAFFSTCSNSGEFCIWPSTATMPPVASGGAGTITEASSSASVQSSTLQTSSRPNSRSTSSSESTHSEFSEPQTSQMTPSAQSQLGMGPEMTSKPAQQSPDALTAASEPAESSSTQYYTIVLTVTTGTSTVSYFNTMSLDPASEESSNKESSSDSLKTSFSRYTETTPFFPTISTSYSSTTKHSSTSSTSAVITPSLNSTEPSIHMNKNSVISKVVPISLSLVFIIGVLFAFAFRRFRKRKGRHLTSKQSNHSSLTSFFPPQYPPTLPPPPRPPRPEAPESPMRLSSKTGLNSFSAIELAAVGGCSSGSHTKTDSVPISDLNQSVGERTDHSGSEVWSNSQLSGSTMVDNQRSSPQNTTLGQGHTYPHYDKRSYPQKIQEVPKYTAFETATARDGQQAQCGANPYDQTRTPFRSHSPISMAPLPLHIAKQASSVSRSSGTSSDGNAAPPRGPLSSRPYIPSNSPRPSTPQRAEHRLEADNISPVRPSLEHVARERFRALDALEGLHEEENRAGDYSPSLYSEVGAEETVSDLELMGSERAQGGGSSARAHEDHIKNGGGWM